MASYNELNALIDAYINRNGVQAITGQILNGVLKAMVEQLGRGYTIMGAALPTDDPGTPDGPECYFASETGTYTDFDGLQIVPGELALLCYTPSDGWTKETIYEGFKTVQATIDGNVGTPSVGVSYANGVLSFDFHNMKGNPGQNGQDGQDGDPAGFGTIGADITGGVGTPGVSVESSGPDTAKNLQFHFTNLKGETGVTSVVATVDNTTGTPACTVSLVGQQLTLAFTGLKGAQGDTGSSVDYPFTIVNNLTTDDATQALSAAQGVVLQGEITQLEHEVTDLGEYIAEDRFVRVVTDSDNKILYGVTPEGDFYFGAGCPSQVKAYVTSVKGSIDADILAEQSRAMAAEALKVNKETGKSLIDSNFAESQSVSETYGWLDVKTDSEDKIIEGVNENGEKFIGKFDEHTEDMIRGLITIPEQIPSVIHIPSLDANFVSPIPVQITGTKGDPSAKYEFLLPETNAFNIRVKFKLKEDILGANDTLDIVSIGGASVTANPIPLSQCITDSNNDTAIDLPYSGVYFENKWPAYMGGVAFNSQSIDPIFGKMNIGRQAFSVRYVGNGSVATVENNGTALVFNIDGVTKSFSFATYPTINGLFEALNDDADFDVVAIALDYHDSSELAAFSSVQLISTLHGATSQTYHPAITEYTDNGPFYLHYAINEDWHQVEIVKMGGKIYSVCDGNTVIHDELMEDNVLTLGGECDVLFEELEIHLDSVADFEYATVPSIGFAVPISEVNPYIVIFEAHDINTYPTYQQPDYGPAGYNQNIDGLDWCFGWCKNNGYVPVSVKDIEDYYIYGKPLPRKCYTIVMDGWHWDTVLNLNKRSVFLKYGVKPCLAIEERQDVMTDIYHNGQQITIDEAVKIAKVNGFDVTNHTINHTSTYAVKPSDRVSFVINLVYNFEADGIDGETYTFPGGCTDPYMNEVFEYLGIKAGIEISRGGSNNITRNRFTLGRLDIGTVYTGTGVKINYNPGKLIKVV